MPRRKHKNPLHNENYFEINFNNQIQMNFYEENLKIHSDIFEAIKKNDLTLVYEILLSSPDVNIPDENGKIPLELVWNMYHDYDDFDEHELWLQIIKIIIAMTSNVNIEDKNGFTPLYYAIISGEEQLTNLLLKKGADKNDINIVDVNGNSLIHNELLHLNNESYRKIKFFLTFSPDLNIKNKEGKTPLDIAKERNLVQYVRLLTSPKNIQTNIETEHIYFPSGHSNEECSVKRTLVPSDCVLVAFAQCGIATKIFYGTLAFP